MARRIRSQEYNGNTFFTSDLGVLKLESPTAIYRPAGLPRGLDLTLATTGTGWFANNTSVSYRLVWGIRDANDNYVYGPPSGRFTITNTSGAATNVSIQFTVPSYITTTHFFQLYRSKAVASGIDPGDELYLCYERNPTAAEIAAALVTAASTIDLTYEALLGDALYTNATQEGIINENTAPPYCRDLCLYKDHMIYAYTKINQNLNINMVGVDAAMIGQTITIAGTTFTGAAAENTATGAFLVYTASTPAVNVQTTAISLVNVINKYATNTRVYAYYVSAYNAVPGKILIQSRDVSDATWTVTSSAGMSKYWSPQTPTTASSLFTSSSDDTQNAIMISKYQQPEHVPYVNKFPVGAKLETIQRAVALRDSVIIFKDNSIWRLTGTSLNDFQITLLDNTVSIVSRDTVVVLNNLAFALTNQGVVAVSDNGVQIVSRQIEYDVIANVRYMLANNLQDNAVAVSHESERTYVLCFESILDQPVYGTGLRICYAYNFFTNSWTRWFLNANCFSVLQDRIYYGWNNATGTVLKQRNGYADFVYNSYPAEMEFCDPPGTLTISAINAATNTVTATFTDAVAWGYSLYPSPSEGWIIFDQVNQKKYYLISVVGNQYTFNTVSGLTTASYSLYRNINMDVLYSLESAGDPFQLKQYDEIVFDLGTMFAYSFKVGFANGNNTQDQPISSHLYGDGTIYSTPTTIPLNDFTLAAFTPFVGYVPHNNKRTYLPRTKQVSNDMYVQVRNTTAGSRFEIKGMALKMRPTGSYKLTQ